MKLKWSFSMTKENGPAHWLLMRSNITTINSLVKFKTAKTAPPPTPPSTSKTTTATQLPSSRSISAFCRPLSFFNPSYAPTSPFRRPLPKRQPVKLPTPPFCSFPTTMAVSNILFTTCAVPNLYFQLHFEELSLTFLVCRSLDPRASRRRYLDAETRLQGLQVTLWAKVRLPRHPTQPFSHLRQILQRFS